MTAIITNKFRVHNAKAFINSTDNYYMFIGRPQAWTNEFTPDVPYDSINHEVSVWDDMMSMKKVNSSSMSNAILNRAWTSGKYYNMYRHDYGTGVFGKNENTGDPQEIVDLADANYYVVSSNYVVYICVSMGTGISTVNPSAGMTYDATHNFISELGDGYRWKLISKPSTSDIVKFKTTAYHPVVTLTTAPPGDSDYVFQWNAQSDSANNAGAVYTIVPNAGGTGYGASSVGIPVTVKGDGTGLVVTARSNGAGAIVQYDIDDYGTGYSWCQLTVGGAGNGATATAIISPLKGLGADPVQDLLGHNVVINTRFEYADGGAFTVVNNFRRIGLVLNPTQYGSPNTLYTNATASTMQTLVITTSDFITPDSIIQDNTTNARGIVVDVLDGVGADAGSKLVRIIRTKDENAASLNPSANFAAPNTVSNVGGAAYSGAIVRIDAPDIHPNSGAVIYVENRLPITRGSDQVEDVRLILEY